MAKFAKIIQENNENFLIKKFIRLFRRKIAAKGKSRFSFVLTGGKSPIKLYKCLSKNNKIPCFKKMKKQLVQKLMVESSIKSIMDDSSVNECR